MLIPAMRQQVILTQKGKTKTVILDTSKVISPEKSSRGRYATFVERLVIPLDQIHIPKPEEELFFVHATAGNTLLLPPPASSCFRPRVLLSTLLSSTAVEFVVE